MSELQVAAHFKTADSRDLITDQIERYVDNQVQLFGYLPPNGK